VRDIDVHAHAATLFDDLFIDELLIGLQHGDRIDADSAATLRTEGSGSPFVEHAIQDHRDYAVAQLAIDRLMLFQSLSIAYPNRAPRGLKRRQCVPCEYPAARRVAIVTAWVKSTPASRVMASRDAMCKTCPLTSAASAQGRWGQVTVAAKNGTHGDICEQLHWFTSIRPQQTIHCIGVIYMYNHRDTQEALGDFFEEF